MHLGNEWKRNSWKKKTQMKPKRGFSKSNTAYQRRARVFFLLLFSVVLAARATTFVLRAEFLNAKPSGRFTSNNWIIWRIDCHAFPCTIFFFFATSFAQKNKSIFHRIVPFVDSKLANRFLCIDSFTAGFCHLLPCDSISGHHTRNNELNDSLRQSLPSREFSHSSRCIVIQFPNDPSSNISLNTRHPLAANMNAFASFIQRVNNLFLLFGQTSVNRNLKLVENRFSDSTFNSRLSRNVYCFRLTAWEFKSSRASAEKKNFSHLKPASVGLRTKMD